MYRILIMEDEKEAAGQLEAALARYGDEHGVDFAVTWATTSLAVPEDARFDLVFMDIELGHENGMSLALELRRRDRTTPLVFVTNLAHYAVRGYQADALDFIVKPVTYGSFSLRMDRAMEVMGRAASRSLTLRTRDGMRLFRASDLVSVEVDGHNLRYSVQGEEPIVVRGSLSHAVDELGGPPFLKISSGCVINMGHVRGFRDAEVTLSDGRVVWISRANKRACLEAISRYLGAGGLR